MGICIAICIVICMVILLFNAVASMFSWESRHHVLQQVYCWTALSYILSPLRALYLLWTSVRVSATVPTAALSGASRRAAYLRLRSASTADSRGIWGVNVPWRETGKVLRHPGATRGTDIFCMPSFQPFRYFVINIGKREEESRMPGFVETQILVWWLFRVYIKRGSIRQQNIAYQSHGVDAWR